jgi:hypothetical protein
MKANVNDLWGGDSGGSDTAGSELNRALGPKFVEEVIRALIQLDAEHLEALAAAAERFRQDAIARMAPKMAPGEVTEMQAKMQLLSALLAETRRNLRIFASTVGESDPFGYKPGRRSWAD